MMIIMNRAGLSLATCSYPSSCGLSIIPCASKISFQWFTFHCAHSHSICLRSVCVLYPIFLSASNSSLVLPSKSHWNLTCAASQRICLDQY